MGLELALRASTPPTAAEPTLCLCSLWLLLALLGCCYAAGFATGACLARGINRPPTRNIGSPLREGPVCKQE